MILYIQHKERRHWTLRWYRSCRVVIAEWLHGSNWCLTTACQMVWEGQKRDMVFASHMEAYTPNQNYLHLIEQLRIHQCGGLSLLRLRWALSSIYNKRVFISNSSLKGNILALCANKLTALLEKNWWRKKVSKWLLHNLDEVKWHTAYISIN